jgi:hypothetical protein
VDIRTYAFGAIPETVPYVRYAYVVEKLRLIEKLYSQRADETVVIESEGEEILLADISLVLHEGIDPWTGEPIDIETGHRPADGFLPRPRVVYYDGPELADADKVPVPLDNRGVLYIPRSAMPVVGFIGTVAEMREFDDEQKRLRDKSADTFEEELIQAMTTPISPFSPHGCVVFTAPPEAEDKIIGGYSIDGQDLDFDGNVL